MRERVCPYCGEPLERQRAWYTLVWCKDEMELEHEMYKELLNHLKTHKIISERRKKERFTRAWEPYLWKMDDMMISKMDYILLPEEVRKLIAFIERTGEKAVAQADLEFDTLIRGSGWKEAPMESTLFANEQIPEAEEPEIAYFYKKKNPRDEFDLQGDLAVGIEDHVVAKIRRVCHHCHNLTPDDLYEYPLVKVYMMATPGSGKTSMLYSMYLNQNEFCERNQSKMMWESIQDMTVDPHFKKFYEEMQKYKITRKAEPTQVRFIPPLLMKVTYREESGKDTVLVVALFDNGGELFVGDENQSTKQNAPLFNQKIKGMDALLCIVNTEHSALERNRYRVDLTEKELESILGQGRLLSAREQEQAEEDPTMEELTVEDMLEESLLTREEIDEKKVTETEHQKRALRENSTKIIENLQLRLGDQTEMKEIVKDKYFALVITKTDRLVNSQMILPEERELFFDRNAGTIHYFSSEERQRKLARNSKMREWKRKNILVQYNLKNFREANYHFVAAYMENQRGIRPIRIEEPLVGIVEDFIRRKE